MADGAAPADAAAQAEQPTAALEHVTDSPDVTATTGAAPEDGSKTVETGEPSAGTSKAGDAPATDVAVEAATDPTTGSNAELSNKKGTTVNTFSNPEAPTMDDKANGEEAATPATPATATSKKGKRKSGASVPEHRRKSLNAKKKAMPEMHLNAEPGSVWLVAMRGYPAWPVVICDEEMLPESLISKRPVGAKRIDGTYRDDFLEGGKNAKDRRYPIMFLSTNEFAWQVNTDLVPLDLEAVKAEVAEGHQGKKSKSLWSAYQIAAAEHDLAWFKDMLQEHEQAVQKDVEEKAEADAKKAEKAEKKAKRKSNAAEAETGDVDMEDAEDNESASDKKPKGSKKRKKDADSEGEPEKAPKTKLKLTAKAKREGDKPKRATKRKSNAKVEADSEDESTSASADDAPVLTAAECRERRQKQVLYLRHRLQKGFLSRDQPPQEHEMAEMSEHFQLLESLHDLEADIIRFTKVHKVLRAIIKLSSIPKEEDFHFKQRSNDLITAWKDSLSAAPTAEEAAAMQDPIGDDANGGAQEPKDVKHDTVNGEEANSIEDVAMADVDADVPVQSTEVPEGEAVATED